MARSSLLSLLAAAAAAAAGASALSFGSMNTPASPASGSTGLVPRDVRDNSGLKPGCKHGPHSRKCWGKYDINTNYYDTIFHTGVTREYWLTVEEIKCAPDGYERICHVANGTMPGPAIVADWGDDVIVHVTNHIVTNGTAIHWHGVRQLNNNEYDGTPGVTQCPIAPGESLTYYFHADQYGSTMWHSHYSVQYSAGLYGPLIINGPAVADYDEDLGEIFMTDWGHETEYQVWAGVATYNVTFEGAPTGIINGVNTGNCTDAPPDKRSPKCKNGGKKFELHFEAGKKYRLRLVNIATEAWFQWSIDGHRLTVIAMDLVPIVPYESDNVLVNMGQRYDVIVEANAKPDDYWMRSGFATSCIPNGAPENITAIVRYDKNSKKEPTTNDTVLRNGLCMDEPTEKLTPWLPVDVTNMNGGISYENVTGEYYHNKWLRWSFNHADGGFLWTNWSNPALGDVVSGDLENIPVMDNVFPVGALNASQAAEQSNKTGDYDWVVMVIEDVTRIPGITHPIHLHGHDFVVLKSGIAKWDQTTIGFNLKNPLRRDTISMPPNGHIVMAWPLDNPGVWSVHCHIPWHSSQGFAATILESPALLPKAAIKDWDKVFKPGCKKWEEYYAKTPYKMDDAGI